MSADSYAVQQSLADQDQEYVFQNRQYTWINDSNSGSYQNQIVIDGGGVSNSMRYLNAQESFIVVPLVMTLTSTTGNLKNSTLENAFAALKNGYSNIIHSMNIECTNNSVVSVMSYSNLAINFKLLTTMSTDDVANLGPSLGFAKDDALGVSYQSGAASAQGLGECNNIITPSVFNPTTGYGKTQFNQNKGRLERMISTSYDPAATGETTANLSAAGKNFSQRDGNGADGKVVNWNVLANIPLGVLSDFFAKFPLCKGAYLRITLNLNTNCSTQMTVNGAGQYTAVSTSSQNGVVPYMISPIGAGSGLDIGGTTAATGLELSIGIARNSINKTGSTYVHPSLQSCRFYACMEDFSPAAEQMYLSKNPTKVIKYDDFLTFQTLNIGAGANFSQILTNSISRVRKLVGIPMISGSFNQAGTAGLINPMASPFTSSPCTTARNAITNFNVLLSGSNLYQANYNYGWEQFIQELRKTNSINGGSSLGLTSGLLSQTDFEHAYRFIVSDLSRSPSEATDNVARSLQIVGTNSGLVPIDIIWVVLYERSVEIDISTGSLVA